MYTLNMLILFQVLYFFLSFYKNSGYIHVCIIGV